MFSNSLAPSIVGAANKVFEIIGNNTYLRDKLEENTKYFKTKIISAGFDVKQGDSPIVPIMLYDAALSQDFADMLLKEGVYAVGFFLSSCSKGPGKNSNTNFSSSHQRTFR